jgi:hypothetical protein
MPSKPEIAKAVDDTTTLFDAWVKIFDPDGLMTTEQQWQMFESTVAGVTLVIERAAEEHKDAP